MSISPKIVVVHVFWKKGNAAECLLLRQTEEKLENNWQIVTGRVKEGESVALAALRELKEETGLVPERFYSADYVETYFDFRHDLVVFAPVFVAFISSKEPVVLSEKEHSLHQWMPIDAALDHLEFSGQREALRHIAKNFINKQPNERFQLSVQNGSKS